MTKTACMGCLQLLSFSTFIILSQWAFCCLALLPELHPSHTQADIFAEVLLDKRMQLQWLSPCPSTLFGHHPEFKKIHRFFHTSAQPFNVGRTSQWIFDFSSSIHCIYSFGKANRANYSIMSEHT